MKILQIIKGLDIGKESGGAELFGVKLAQKLNAIGGNKVFVCAFYSLGTETEQAWKDRLNDQGIVTFFVSDLNNGNRTFAFLRGVIHLIKRFRKEKLDVTQSHFQLGTLAGLILKLVGISKLAFRTAHIREEWNRGKDTWFLKPIFIDRIFPLCLNGEVGVSQAVCDYMLSRPSKSISSTKVHLIYNGISETEIIQQSLVTVDNRPIRGTPTLISVGRLAEQKGYVYMLEAMQLLRNRNPEVKLWIIGDGEDRAQLEAMIDDLSLKKHVTLLGLRPNVPALLKMGDIFVLSSLWEGLPTNVMEAMVCELPVVATAIPGTVELVKHEETGLLVPQKDPLALVEAITRLADDNDLQSRLIRNARDFVNEFDMSKIAQDYIKLYNQPG